jgi:hypothetical protein
MFRYGAPNWSLIDGRPVEKIDHQTFRISGTNIMLCFGQASGGGQDGRADHRRLANHVGASDGGLSGLSRHGHGDKVFGAPVLGATSISVGHLEPRFGGAHFWVAFLVSSAVAARPVRKASAP